MSMNRNVWDFLRTLAYSFLLMLACVVVVGVGAVLGLIMWVVDMVILSVYCFLKLFK